MKGGKMEEKMENGIEEKSRIGNPDWELQCLPACICQTEPQR